MPTATSTLCSSPPTTTSTIKLPPSPLPSFSTTSAPSSPSVATLKSLYSRAARAFIHREISLTHTLLASAFSLLKPPISLHKDSLNLHRRKWDILRITLETTVYASPPTARDSLPPELLENLLQSPQSLINSLYTRSLDLFTPTPQNLKAKLNSSAAYLPAQVLKTLALSSMKLDAPDVGRAMVEDWLARRGQLTEEYEALEDSDRQDDGYEMILDLYCLHILPRLDQWDYAREFLQYEGELKDDRRERLKSSLQTLHSQTVASRLPPPANIFTSSNSNPASPSRSPRPYSPSPSTSSSSSSNISTTSNRTVIPRTPRPFPHIPTDSTTPLLPAQDSPPLPSSSSDCGSDTTVTRALLAHPTPTPIPRPPLSNSSKSTSASSTFRTRAQTQIIPQTPSASTYSYYAALIKTTLSPYLTSSNLTTFILFFVIFPLVSLVFRIRRRRRLGGGAGVGTTADQVRRRLQARASETGMGLLGLKGVWAAVLRVVGDTIRMGGSGLV